MVLEFMWLYKCKVQHLTHCYLCNWSCTGNSELNAAPDMLQQSVTANTPIKYVYLLHRLLNSPGRLAVGPSVRYDLCDWFVWIYRMEVCLQVQWILGKLQCILCSCKQWNSHCFSDATDSALHSPDGKQITCHQAVQVDCETI